MRRPKAKHRDTQQLIADAFCDKVRAHGLSKVRIAELISELGINRNTFYYYFSSKYDVAAYVFRKGLDKALRARIPEPELICEQSEEDPFSGLAFYGCEEIGARRLNDNEFMEALLECLQSDIPLYRNLFTYRELEFIEYVHRLWTTVYRRNVSFMLDHRQISEDVKEALIEYCVSGLIGLAVQAVQHPSVAERARSDQLNLMRNYPLDSIHHAINGKAPIGRARYNAREYVKGL